jgi:hypothetical protein
MNTNALLYMCFYNDPFLLVPLPLIPSWNLCTYLFIAICQYEGCADSHFLGCDALCTGNYVAIILYDNYSLPRPGGSFIVLIYPTELAAHTCIKVVVRNGKQQLSDKMRTLQSLLVQEQRSASNAGSSSHSAWTARSWRRRQHASFTYQQLPVKMALHPGLNLHEHNCENLSSDSAVYKGILCRMKSSLRWFQSMLFKHEVLHLRIDRM